MRPAAPEQRSGGSTKTAVDDEVARFAAIADAWWDPEGEFRPLHRLNPLRVAYIRNHVAGHFDRDPLASRPFVGLSLLDVGCGGGLVSEPMARLGARVTAIDAEEKSVRIARSHARRHGLDIDYRCALPEDLLAEGQAFDIVVAMEIVEHVADPGAFLEISASLLRPGGAMAMATLNRTLKALALAKIGAEYVLRWLPAGTHDWNRFVRPSELVRGLRRHGIDVRDLSGMTYNPVEDHWSLSRDLAVNYLAFGVKR